MELAKWFVLHANGWDLNPVFHITQETSSSVLLTLFHGCLFCAPKPKTIPHCWKLTKVVKMLEVPYSVCLIAAHLSNSLRGYLSTLAPGWSLTWSCEKAPFLVSPSWLRSGWDLWGAGSSLHSSGCRTWLCHEHRSPVTPSELSLHVSPSSSACG